MGDEQSLGEKMTPAEYLTRLDLVAPKQWNYQICHYTMVIPAPPIKPISIIEKIRYTYPV